MKPTPYEKFCAVRSLHDEDHIFGSASLYDKCLLIHANIPFPKKIEDAFAGASWFDRLQSMAKEIKARLLIVKNEETPREVENISFIDIRQQKHCRFSIDDLYKQKPWTQIIENSALDWRETPIYLICTNGKKDKCCAKFGLPIYSALVEEHPDQEIYQCTHIGGDRFAANVVVLPFGIYYGRVAIEDGSLDAIMKQTAKKKIFLDKYRGVTTLSFEHQNVEYYFRKFTGLLHLDLPIVIQRLKSEQDLRFYHITYVGKTYSMTLKKVIYWNVLTCGATKPANMAKYELVSMVEAD